MIEIRRATPSDGDVLGEIHAASWEAAYAPFFEAEFASREVRARRTRWHARVTDDSGTILLAELDGRPLALSFTGPSPDRPRLAEIRTFFAHPDAWGTGVSAALMGATLDRLHEDGYRGAHLWTLRDTPRSRRFYVKSGFTESGAVRTHDFGDGTPLAQVEYVRTP
ncbi:GNAT family N-acetyltransferase [Streptomyces sp. NPDC051578]|uniref:GNAT family N-acetyltransferase n=1 Tax=Streptomyces sp. NPDC051578 TaxID=3365662 RepID=UPI0037BCE96C